MEKPWVVVAVVALLASACGSSGKSPDAASGGSGGGSGAGGGGSGGSGGGGGGGGGGGAVDAREAGTTPDVSVSPDARSMDVSAPLDTSPPRDGPASVDGPVQGGGGVFIELIRESAGMTVAMDAAGVLHAAASARDASGKYLAVYARCAARCAEPGSWSAVALAETSTGHVPTIALTQDGRPRIAYYVAVGTLPGSHYLECDSGCLTAPSWKDVRLSSNFAVTPFPRPGLPFAVSPGGAAAFAYDDGTGLQLFLCKSACGSGASWAQGTIAGVFIVPESLAFGSDQNLQIVARQRVQEVETLVFLDCSADCTMAASWDGVVGLWRANGVIEALLARTAQGGSRIAVYADDPNTPKVERVFGFLACDGQCRMPASWKAPLLLPIAPGAAEVGYALALDSGGRPVLAYADLASSAISRCMGDCTTTAGLWTAMPGLADTDLNRAFPVTVPASCISGSWGMYTGPALTLTADKPIVAVTAGSKGFGGQCGSGSTYIETGSFLALPP
jgi:hypothetical protein